MMQKFTEFCLARRASLFGFKNKKTTVSEEIDLASATFFQNPYPTYQRLRKTSPIVAVKPAGHLLTRHADIAEALASPDLRNTPSRFSVLNSRNAKRYEAARLANNILPFLDPPENKVRRQCLIRAVHSRLNQWQTGIDAVADKQMQTFLRDKGDDLIEDFSSPLSLGLMCDFIGIPESEKQRYKQLSEAFFYLFAPLSNAEKFEQVNEVLAVFRTEFQGLLDKRVLEPKPDLISALLVAEEEGEKLDHDEIVDSCMLVFADGVENVEAGIANVLSAFHQDKQAQKMFAESELSLEEVVSEGLRLQTPAQFIARIANQDMQICGAQISAETPVFLSLASANRDEEVFENAGNMRPGRSARDIFTFGRGSHACIGSRLSSLQINAALKQILTAELKPKLHPDQIIYRPRLAHRWPKAFPVYRG